MSDTRVNRSSPQKVVDALVLSLGAASAHNPNATEKPVAVIWTDRDSYYLSERCALPATPDADQ